MCWRGSRGSYLLKNDDFEFNPDYEVSRDGRFFSASDFAILRLDLHPLKPG